MNAQELLREIKVSALVAAALLIVLCGAYPLVVWGLAQVAFPGQANGSLVARGGQMVGSALIAQNFSSPQYFHPRPSAAGGTGYDGTSSGGSNLGPLSQKLIDQVKERASAYRAENHLSPDAPIPGDAVTASGSGLDPHISLKNAELQTARVAQARGLSPEQVRKLVETCIDGPGLGFLGDPGVNVLKVNLTLDALASGTHGR
ncbi:MAG: K(+)-transporting ATPase subunit C [Syntrophobacterales bacterium]|jgi:K+-transporting ATPase ATPase C chain|nr:K(+)-transporting ATPase subunit C [Syntrophobacterales bacterium]